MGIELRVVGIRDFQSSDFTDVCGILVQYPTTDGRIEDYSELCNTAHKAGTLVVAACDILALVLLKPPGEWGADIAIGNTQRFGVSMGYGGPHAAYIATHDKFARRLPGRVVGVSKDAEGRDAYRLAIQTREQHIKRDKRHEQHLHRPGPARHYGRHVRGVARTRAGLRRIARGACTASPKLLADGLQQRGVTVRNDTLFDTISRCRGR